MPGNKKSGTGTGYEGIGEEQKKGFEQPRRNDQGGQGGFEKGTDRNIGPGKRDVEQPKRGGEQGGREGEKREDTGTKRERPSE